jgi:transcription initiation factor TFIID subunit 1
MGRQTTDHTSSMFPVNNPALVHDRWEDDIIWDTEAVPRIPKPIIPRLDPNDPDIILGIPEEVTVTITSDKDGKKDGRPKAKLSLMKAGSKAGSETSQSSLFGKKDPFNLSNDEFYNPRHVSSTQGLSGLDSTVVQHSLPALALHTAWFPTHLSLHALRNFHRPKLRLRCDNRRGTTGFITVEGLVNHIAQRNKEREKERESSGGGEVFFMRTPEDVSACDGELILAEYCEQHPPLLMSTGMATRIRNYYRRPERQVKSHAPRLQFGETTYVQSSSYFLGQLHSGQLLQSFETNLFRAPIYRHTMLDTDLVVIISGSQVFVRDVPTVFLVGQQCPKVEVPPPNSKSAMQFQKDFLLLFLYKLFRESDDSPPRIKMEAVRKAFPPAAMSESVIRKVLKQCADFKREGYENGWWVLRSDCRLPSEEELRSMISPEQVCAYYSTLVSEQRLKDAGYRGKSLFIVEEEEEESTQKIDDEVSHVTIM